MTHKEIVMLTEPKTVLPLAIVSTTDITRFNALRHGVLSRYTVLPTDGPHRDF
jgi:hypothetical protein